jgi:hypothetical protein
MAKDGFFKQATELNKKRFQQSALGAVYLGVCFVFRESWGFINVRNFASLLFYILFWVYLFLEKRT